MTDAAALRPQSASPTLASRAATPHHRPATATPSLREIIARIRAGKEVDHELSQRSYLRPGSATPSLKNRRLFVACAADPPATLPRPISTGLLYAAQVGSFEELAERNILDVDDDDKAHLGQEEVEAVYHTKCLDQGCPETLDRKTRFYEVIAQQCRGQWFVLRQCGAGARCAETICNTLVSNEHYTHLDLSGNNLGVEGAKSIARLLQSNETICVLRLQSCNLGEGAYHIADALHKNKSLTAVDLSGICGIHRNNIWGKSATALGLMMQANQVLSFLNVSSCGLQRAAGPLVRSCIPHVALTHLDISSNKIGDEACDALVSFFQLGTCRLEALHLAHNGITPDGISKVCHAIAGHGTPALSLQSLTLSGNVIGAKGCEALAAMVVDHKNLRHLAIDETKLCFLGTDEDGYRIPESSVGVEVFAKALAENSSLESISMNCCDICVLPENFGHFLANHSKLTRLELSENWFGDAGAAVVAHGLKFNVVLERLVMTGCRIGNKGGMVLAAAIPRHPTLTSLKLFEGASLNFKQSGLLDAVRHSRSMLQFDCGRDDAAVVNPALHRNKLLRIQRAGPELAEKHDALATEREALLHTQGLIVDEQKRREKLTEAFKVMREKQKAASAQFRNELQDLTDQLERGKHQRRSLESQSNTLEETLAENKIQKEAEANRMSRKVEGEVQRRLELRAKASKLRAELSAKEADGMKPLLAEHDAVAQQVSEAKKLFELMQKHVQEAEKKMAASTTARPATGSRRKSSATAKRK